METSDIFVIIIMFLLIFGATYIFTRELTYKNDYYKKLIMNVSRNIPEKSIQFFPNTRFESNRIEYHISEDCDQLKRVSLLTAFRIIENNTLIKFKEGVSKNGIFVSCSGNSSELTYEENSNRETAGFTKPKDIINATNFYILNTVNVDLIKPERCEIPQIALHEIFHALGFDHSSNEKDVMFPVVICGQKINPEIFDEINRIYSIPSGPDIAIDKIEINKTGRYINILIEASNYGISDAETANLVISSDKKVLKEYAFSSISVGRTSELTIKNLPYTGNGSLSIEIKNLVNEDLNPENNKVVVNLE